MNALHSSRHTRLGQHFLTRPEIAGMVANSAGLSPADTVLEIGPGRGILTRELLMRAGRVVAIEKDRELVGVLGIMFKKEIDEGRLVLLEQDVRDFDPGVRVSPLPEQYALVANIPYYITGRIMRQFLTTRHQPSVMALLVQKEVAERVCARTGKQSLLSLSVAAYGTPELVRTVPAGAFAPPPKVASAILAIHDIGRGRFDSPEHEHALFSIMRAAFAAKRKRMRGTVPDLFRDGSAALCGVAENARPEDVSLEQWLCCARRSSTA